MDRCPKCSSFVVVCQGGTRCQNCGFQQRGVSMRQLNKTYESFPAPGTVRKYEMEEEEDLDALRDIWHKKPVNIPKPLVSIIMPTYKRQHSILHSIASILLQNFIAWELVIIDNEPGNKYNFSDPRIRYYNHSEEQGAAFARNMGIQYTSSDCIVFFDDDDIMQPYYLELMVAPFVRDPNVNMSVCRIRLVEGIITTHENFCTPAVMIRKKLALPVWGTTPDHDQRYFRKIYERIPRESVVNIPDILVHAYTSQRGGIREGAL